MNDQRKDLEDTDEIREITETLEQLEITVSKLKERRNSLIERKERRKSARIRASKANAKRGFKLGDIVEVQDNYKGRRGIVGKITSFHGGQVYVQPIDGSTGFRKYKENVKLFEG